MQKKGGLTTSTIILVVVFIIGMIVGVKLYNKYIISEETNNIDNGKLEQTKEFSYTTPEEYYETIDYSCNIDSDCEVKNIGVCPNQKCVNKDFNVDTKFLEDYYDKKAEETGDQLVCGAGARNINGCECISNKCEEIPILPPCPEEEFPETRQCECQEGYIKARTPYIYPDEKNYSYCKTNVSWEEFDLCNSQDDCLEDYRCINNNGEEDNTDFRCAPNKGFKVSCYCDNNSCYCS